jgi:hypothetical protein
VTRQAFRTRWKTQKGTGVQRRGIGALEGHAEAVFGGAVKAVAFIPSGRVLTTTSTLRPQSSGPLVYGLAIAPAPACGMSHSNRGIGNDLGSMPE